MTKEELKERFEHAKENPGTLFGFIYPYFLVIILGVGLYYLPNIGTVAQQNIPPRISDVPVVADLTIQQPKTVPPVDLQKMSEPTADLLEKGKTIFVTSCAACHGEAGTGTGPGSIGLNPAPRNFTSGESWKNGRTLSAIYTSIQDGLPNSAMIAYDFLTPEDKFGLVHYIRSEFINDPPKIGETELETLNALYNLTAGTQQPGQIPTETSINLIAEQNLNKIKTVDLTLEKITSDNGTSAKLLLNVTDDLRLALSALSNSDYWKTDESSFIKFLTSNVNQNGFNQHLFNLTQSEWIVLYNYCSGLI